MFYFLIDLLAFVWLAALAILVAPAVLAFLAIVLTVVLPLILIALGIGGIAYSFRYGMKHGWGKTTR